jgi:alanyl-tRNA synthetase
VAALAEEAEWLRRRVQALEREIGRQTVRLLVEEAQRIDGSAVIAARVPAAGPEMLREMGDWLRDQLKSAVVVLGTSSRAAQFHRVVTPDLIERIPRRRAGRWWRRSLAAAAAAG